VIDVRLKLETDDVLDLVDALDLRQAKAGPTDLIRALVEAAMADPGCLSTEHRMIIDAKLCVMRPAPPARPIHNPHDTKES